MRIIQNYVRDLLSSAIAKCSTAEIVQEFAKHPNVSVAKPKFGDYQWNDALSLFKLAKDSLTVGSPKELAELVKENIEKTAFSSVNVSPQGFLTFVFSKEWIEEEIKSLAINGVKPSKLLNGVKVGIDFSSPNIAKEMHVGHLRSTIIGDSIARILEFHGYEVFRINHLGDWGTQFGMLIEYMYEKYPDFLTSMPSISDLTKFYKEAKLRMDTDEEFKKKSRSRVVKLQSGDKDSRMVWKVICDLSMEAFNEIYKRLDIKFEVYGESFYNDFIPDVVKELKEKGIAEDSQGAIVVFTDVSPAPLMLVKSDGGYGYDTTDMACIRYRIQELKCDWVIYVTDVGQAEHFAKIFKAARDAGWADHENKRVRLDHVGFGMILNDFGEKFKTRSGETVKLVDLLDVAVERASAELEKRLQNQTEDDLDAQSDLKGVSETLGYGAVKYYDLNRSILSNYKFSFDSMLDPRGNTAVYLLYAYARICAIFRKSGINFEELDISALSVSHTTEIALAKCILKFPAVLDTILKDLAVNRLTEYLYDISCQFSAFYTQCKVVGDSEQNSRLILCHCTRMIMKTCFNLIGIKPLERI
ncbi:arginyl-tRNA synthetase, putative [Theileria equi strain WA]|uniref:arginine--tRNA ligase n=1 Tax=Theileria equi strain WA TaxID=1537102 RepID=L0AZZ1_THEEQ|nr:arginyl-tRNA synthetase, putative [Theileria equi strain WA]AFZ81177.1 arginyl-tRNA synthetase, putative [Theileria equi strain WA]|eukprot:XP_004830843.1 arginyl-tRNA synthetase, putative [Theileria equi strain WA]